MVSSRSVGALFVVWTAAAGAIIFVSYEAVREGRAGMRMSMECQEAGGNLVRDNYGDLRCITRTVRGEQEGS